jgi:hypothetical protein
MGGGGDRSSSPGGSSRVRVRREVVVVLGLVSRRAVVQPSGDVAGGAARGVRRADKVLEPRRGGSGHDCGSPICGLSGPNLGRLSGRGLPARWEAAGAVVRLCSGLSAEVDHKGLDLGLWARYGPDLDLSGSGVGRGDKLPLVRQLDMGLWLKGRQCSRAIRVKLVGLSSPLL